MSRPRPLRFLPLVTVLLVTALLASLCGPAEAKRSKRRPRAKATSTRLAPAPAPAPALSGMVVGIDPETGRLGMPTAAQMLELSAAERTGLLRTSEGLTEVQLPDGSWMVDLQGRFMEFSVVSLDPLGRVRILPANEEAALLRLLLRPPAAPTPAAEER